MPRLASSAQNPGAFQDRGIFKYGERVLWSLSDPTHYLPKEAIDHLLRSVRLSAAVPGQANLSAPFGVDVAYGADTLVIYEAHDGDCQVSFDAEREPIDFRQGDLLMLPCDVRHRIASAPDVPCIDIRDLLAQQVEPHIEDPEGQPSLRRMLDQRVHYGGGGKVFGLRMILMYLDKSMSGALVSGLRGPLHLKNSAYKHRSFINAIFDEFDVRHTGTSIKQPVATRLAEALLTIVLTEEAKNDVFYEGLSDPAVARVIRAVYGEPEKQWELQDLVEIACISRSALNGRFLGLVGMSPRQFVSHVRLTRASEMLMDTSLSIAVIAERSNYGSEAAFNRAFRRWCGLTPGSARKIWINNNGAPPNP